MAEKGFEPLTSQLGIAGTSYRLQLGLINEKWASRILKGKDVIDSYVYKDEDISDEGFPNQNLVVGWVLRTITLPNINPYGIMKTTGALVKQAMTNKEKRKVVAPVSETKKVELEKVPDHELKRPKAQGWVKEDQPSKEPVSEAEKRAAFQERLKAKKEEEAKKGAVAESETKAAPAEAASPKSDVKTVKTSRKLPSIPSADSSTSSEEISEEPKAEEAEAKGGPKERDLFCPYCGKDLDWKFCPYCGKPLPHAHND